MRCDWQEGDLGEDAICSTPVGPGDRTLRFETRMPEGSGLRKRVENNKRRDYWGGRDKVRALLLIFFATLYFVTRIVSLHMISVRNWSAYIGSLYGATSQA